MSLFTYYYFISDVKANETQSANEGCVSPPDERSQGETEGKMLRKVDHNPVDVSWLIVFLQRRHGAGWC